MKRNKTLDIARGISIVFIVLSHTAFGYSYLFTFFYVQIFFYLGGVFMKHSDTLESTLYKKVKALLCPYFLFGICCAILCVALGRVHISNISILDPDTFDNGPEWFLIALFTLTIIKLAMNSIKTRWIEYVFAIIIFAIAYWAGYNKIDDSTNIVKAGISLPFLLAGTYHLQIETFIKKFRLQLLILFITMWSLCVFVLQVNIGIRWLLLPCNPLIYLFASYTGIGLIISISYILVDVKYIRNILSYFGFNSLFILCMHWPIVRMVDVKLQLNNNLLLFCFCISVCFFTAFVGSYLKKWIPMLR